MAGGARKHGRNKEWCKRYKAAGTRLKNKIRKLRRHLSRTNGSKRKGTSFLRHANDQRAKSALTKLS